MTAGKYLRMLLTADGGVAALAADRVFTEVLPQAPVVPAVVFTEVAGDEDVALDIMHQRRRRPHPKRMAPLRPLRICAERSRVPSCGRSRKSTESIFQNSKALV